MGGAIANSPHRLKAFNLNGMNQSERLAKLNLEVESTSRRTEFKDLVRVFVSYARSANNKSQHGFEVGCQNENRSTIRFLLKDRSNLRGHTNEVSFDRLTRFVFVSHRLIT